MKMFLLFSSLMNQKDIKSEEEEDNEFGKINQFKEIAKGLKNYFEKNDVENIYSEYDHNAINDDGNEDHNIIRVDIRKNKTKFSKKK